jgi:hypothetical protein
VFQTVPHFDLIYQRGCCALVLVARLDKSKLRSISPIRTPIVQRTTPLSAAFAQLTALL